MATVHIIITDPDDVNEKSIETTKECCKDVMKVFDARGVSTPQMYATLATLLFFLQSSGELDNAPAGLKAATRKFLDELKGNPDLIHRTYHMDSTAN